MKASSAMSEVQDVLSKRHIVIGVGEFAVAGESDAVIVTHALGSSVAVCLFDPVARVAGMIHVLLPDSRIRPERASMQPATFADTGIPMLFHAAYERGARKVRCRVQLIGGASLATAAAGSAAQPSIGWRTILAAQQILWRNGVLVDKEDVGGSSARSVVLDVGDGTVQFGNALTGASVL